MRTRSHACLAGLGLSLAILCAGSFAQNAPAASAKPAEQKPATGTDDKKPADAAKNKEAAKPADAKSSDAKSTNAKPADPKAADPKAAAKPGDAQAAAGGPANNGDKELRKNVKADGPPCVVAEFRSLGLDVHDPAKRRTQAMTWLKKRAKNCSVDQLLMIRNNRSQWMGTADSATLAAEVDALLEVFAADNPQVAALLYGTVQPPSEEGK